MKFRLLLAILLLIGLQVMASAQCAKAEMLTEWDAKLGDFKCVHAGGGPVDHSVPGFDSAFKSAKERKGFCDVVLTNLLKACPTGVKGQRCRERASKIHDACVNKDPETAGSERRLDSDVFPLKTDRKSCRTIFASKVKSCRKRFPSIGDERDGCEAEARNERDECLANSR
jgi:hypothetical protein